MTDVCIPPDVDDWAPGDTFTCVRCGGVARIGFFEQRAVTICTPPLFSPTAITRTKIGIALVVVPVTWFFAARALVGRARRRLRAFVSAAYWALRGALVLATGRRWRCALCLAPGRRRTVDACARCWRLGLEGIAAQPFYVDTYTLDVKKSGET